LSKALLLLYMGVSVVSKLMEVSYQVLLSVLCRGLFLGYLSPQLLWVVPLRMVKKNPSATL